MARPFHGSTLYAPPAFVNSLSQNEPLFPASMCQNCFTGKMRFWAAPAPFPPAGEFRSAGFNSNEQVAVPS